MLESVGQALTSIDPGGTGRVQDARRDLDCDGGRADNRWGHGPGGRARGAAADGALRPHGAGHSRSPARTRLRK